MVLTYSDKISRVSPYSFVYLHLLDFDYRIITFFDLPSHAIRLSSPCFLCIHLGSSAFARRYLQNRFYFLFLRLLRYFNSPGIAYFYVSSSN